MAMLTGASPVRRWCAAALALLALAWLVTGPGRYWLHEFDRQVLNETLMDSLARLRTNEDWAIAEPLRQPQDYGWRQTVPHPIRIAHALGDSGLPTANTLGAMQRAHQVGLRFFEVDISDEDGRLRCQHDPGAPTPVTAGTCSLETLLEALPPDSWLVLDIKTDFVSTGQRVVDLLRDRDVARRVIFQLYLPDQVAIFNRWQSRVPLPGPIVTAYLTHRRMNHVATHVARIGVKVLALPMERIVAMQRRPAGLALYFHPVHDCEAWRAAMEAQAEGVYVLATLHCAGVDSSEKVSL